MKRTRKICATILALALVASVLSGCAKSEVPQLSDPKIAPPDIKEAGKLYVGVDYGRMPYSGEINGELEGIDIDVASLIASDLGLEVEFVEVPHDDNATAISEGTVDIVMSCVLGEVDSSAIVVSGVYAQEAPAIFSTVSQVEGIKANGLGNAHVGVQANTMAAGSIAEKAPMETVTYDTLNEAFDALVAGDVQAVACDAVVGAYLCGHYKDTAFVEQIGSVQLIGAGVAAENTNLQAAVQGVLDAARDDGRLELVLAKWVGDLPDLSLETTNTTTPSEGESGEESTANGADGGITN